MPGRGKDPEADRLARALAKTTGETLTAAVVQALRERLIRVRRGLAKRRLADEWPKGYVESFAGVPDDFARLPQGEAQRRAKLK